MDLLLHLQRLPCPSGDEAAIASFIQRYCDGLPGVTVWRTGDLVLATKGTPRVAIFAHLDTIGFTQGYDRKLIPIGGPKVEGGEKLRAVASGATARLKVSHADGKPLWRLSGKQGAPGERWVYAEPLLVKAGRVRGPYLDNRAGVWNALRVLEGCENAAVVFTPGEEHSGGGAAVGARLVSEELNIRRALISDITWHTKSIKCGKGPAISLRDRYVPPQRFLQEVLAAAEASGFPFQREVESDGGSDGAVIERSPYPIDWVFIGAPQKRPHTPRETCHVADLEGMVALYLALLKLL